jgi:hypothetical protein
MDVAERPKPSKLLIVRSNLPNPSAVPEPLEYGPGVKKLPRLFGPLIPETVNEVALTFSATDDPSPIRYV